MYWKLEVGIHIKSLKISLYQNYTNIYIISISLLLKFFKIYCNLLYKFYCGAFNVGRPIIIEKEVIECSTTFPHSNDRNNKHKYLALLADLRKRETTICFNNG